MKNRGITRSLQIRWNVSSIRCSALPSAWINFAVWQIWRISSVTKFQSCFVSIAPKEGAVDTLWMVFRLPPSKLGHPSSWLGLPGLKPAEKLLEVQTVQSKKNSMKILWAKDLQQKQRICSIECKRLSEFVCSSRWRPSPEREMKREKPENRTGKENEKERERKANGIKNWNRLKKEQKRKNDAERQSYWSREVAEYFGVKINKSSQSVTELNATMAKKTKMIAACETNLDSSKLS